MERFIHYVTYGTFVTFDDPVVLFREQEWATRERNLAQLEWLVRERGKSLRFFFFCCCLSYLFINFLFNFVIAFFVLR
jgi:Ca2+-dependent lipid-binding protein